jgi:hypothetical protein
VSTWRAVTAVLAIACGTVTFVAGGPIASPTTDGDGVALAPGSEIAYQLAWSWAGARWLDDERIYVFTTDLGYTVGLVGGQVGNASLELVPCEAPSAGLLAPRPAAAAHASLADDSRAWAPALETLPAAQSSYFGAGVASGRRYCGLHYLIAPVPGDPSHASAAIRGWYIPPGAHARVAFDVAVSVRGGALRDLDATTVVGDRGATVVLRRHPARALDGAALELLGERELAYAFLRGLGRTATVELASR